MKAGERKELETNTLADKVGHAMQRVKGSSRRNVLLYVVGVAVVAVAIWGTYRYFVISGQETSLQWVMFDDGSSGHFKQLAGLDTFPGKAARFEIAWFAYWETGVRLIGVDPQGAMSSLDSAGRLYKRLAEECKDDPIFEPQALLGIAVVEETRAVNDPRSLDRAKEAYKNVVDKYEKSAEGKFAKKRLDVMSDKTKLKELETVYEDLQRSLQLAGALQPPPNFMNPNFLAPKDKDDKEPEKEKDKDK